MAERARVVLGLNSGTSADGVDVAACEIRGRGQVMRVRLIGHVHRAYVRSLRDRILAAMAPADTRTEEICRLNVEIGRAFADAAAATVKALGLRRVDAIGSHGQTFCHLPPGSRLDQGDARSRSSHSRGRLCHKAWKGVKGEQVSATLQIGDPAVIAARLRAPVVARFREADMAVGGQGAPLVPWTDYVLFRDPRRNRVIQNIGGIANLTWLPAGGGLDDVIAFDTGPGNMVIDGLVRRFSRGQEAFDRGGRRAARGRVHDGLLRRLLRHPFFRRRPPKSCGREEFGEGWMDGVLRSNAALELSPDDWVATATAFTAATIGAAYARFLRSPRGARAMPDEVIVCGGGASNKTLLKLLAVRLRSEFSPTADGIEITTTRDHGIPPQAKEAVSFAMLAAACLDGVAANLPNVTGAERRVVLGQICNLESHA